MLDISNLTPKFTDLEIFDSKNSLIGKGTFGIVKLAKSSKTNKKYALKIVETSKLEKDDIFSIEREMQIHSKINHSNVIKFYGHHKEKQEIIMILEYASNGNLFSYIRKKKRLSESEAFQFFYQTAQALSYLHKNDILHRDIKPENLLLDEKNNIKLCDFGWSTQGISLKRNTFCGTYEYMSPEVVFKRPYNENIDVWALGILLYEMVQGKSPYRAKNIKEISQKLLSDNKLSFTNDTSQDLLNLITNILRFNPSERLSLNDIFEHSWVKRMYAFVNYKEKFEESSEEKVLTRGTSFSIISENYVENFRKHPNKSKTVEYAEIFTNENFKEKVKRKKKIFDEIIVDHGTTNILKEMKNLMEDLEVLTFKKKKQNLNSP